MRNWRRRLAIAVAVVSLVVAGVATVAVVLRVTQPSCYWSVPVAPPGQTPPPLMGITWRCDVP